MIDHSQNEPPKLERFKYDRDACRPGVLHVGVGAFHRAHQAVYLDSLLHDDDMRNWGVVGINLRSSESALVDQLARQDHRYVLKTLSPVGEVRYREIGALLESADWSRDASGAAAIAARREIQMISMTVTESGYYLLDNDLLDLDAPPVHTGLETGGGSCIYTFLHAALNARLGAGGDPLTLLCCDNLRDNGGKLKRGLTQYLEAAGDRRLLDWMAELASFPCCMVDRITPRMDRLHAEDVRRRFGVDDELTVMAETFIQWIVEDNFAGDRPALDRVGVEMVADVEPYEDAKIRLLNGGHTILVYLAALKGFKTYDEGMRNPELAAFFDRYEAAEVIPAIGESPIDLQQYHRVIRDRFRNDNIGDSVARIAMDGVSKFRIFVYPTLIGCYRQGITPLHGIEAVASWYQFMRHMAAGKMSFEYIEPRWDWIEPLLVVGRERDFASSTELWNELPSAFPAFVGELESAIGSMQRRFPVD